MTDAENLARHLELQLHSWRAALGGADDDALDRRPSPDKWSAREHLAHVGRMHEIYADRIAAILGSRAPELPPYRAEDDPKWSRWREMPAPEILERAARLREELASRLRLLSETDLDRIGVHGRLGPLPLSLWLHLFLVHEAHHLYQILKLVRER